MVIDIPEETLLIFPAITAPMPPPIPPKKPERSVIIKSLLLHNLAVTAGIKNIDTAKNTPINFTDKATRHTTNIFIKCT